MAHDMALAAGGDFLLRIEDIDQSRARTEWEEQIYDDLRWLGLSWETPVMRQSERMHAYATALADLWERDLLFACVCNRRDIQDAANAPQEGAPAYGPDGIVYPGTCRKTMHSSDHTIPKDTALRLAMDVAVARFEQACFTETGNEAEKGRIDVSGSDITTHFGDLVLARRDMGTSYHLSVVLDDAHQGITHVVRGQDLFEATKIHVVLQKLLGLPTPVYHHHTLIRDESGKRLAKRDDARSISAFRQDGASPADIRAMVGL